MWNILNIDGRGKMENIDLDVLSKHKKAYFTTSFLYGISCEN